MLQFDLQMNARNLQKGTHHIIKPKSGDLPIVEQN